MSPCYSLAEVHRDVAFELFNIAFSCLWGILNDKEKEQIITSLITPIMASSDGKKKESHIPNRILQMILNLAEFM